MTTLPSIFAVSGPAEDQPASRAEVVATVSYLDRVLPSAQPRDAKLLLAAYAIALDGTTCGQLRDGVRYVLQGKLGHPFMPGPGELYEACHNGSDFLARWARNCEALPPPNAAPPLVPESPKGDAPPIRLSPFERRLLCEFRVEGVAALRRNRIALDGSLWAELGPKFDRLIAEEAAP